MKAAKLAYEKGEVSYENAKRSVEMSVRQTFYSLINMKESIETNQKAFAVQTYKQLESLTENNLELMEIKSI